MMGFPRKHDFGENAMKINLKSEYHEGTYSTDQLLKSGHEAFIERGTLYLIGHEYIWGAAAKSIMCSGTFHVDHFCEVTINEN